MDNTTNSKTVLVVGATGFLGMEICRQLVAAERQVKGLVRPTSAANKIKKLQAMGVTTVEGDLKDVSSLRKAFENVTAIISTASALASQQQDDTIAAVDDQGQRNAIDVAEALGVKQFIYISFNSIPTDFPLQLAKRRVERHLVQSNIIYTILRSTAFMETWLSPVTGFDYIHAKATIYGEGKKKLRWISARDVAAYAVASLDNFLAKNKVIQIGGPEALNPLEVVRIFEEESKRKFDVAFVPEAALQAQANAAEDAVTQTFAGLMLGYAQGSDIDTDEAAEVYSVTLTSVQDYAKKATEEMITLAD